MAEEIIQKQMTLLPEYQEKFLKDLLANIYQTDEETGEITGIAARSPLFGQPVYQAEGGGTTTDPSLAALDEAGSKIQYYQTAEGEFTTDPTMAEMDQYGQPIFATEGGVAAPDVIGFTDPQVEAIRRLTGYTDPDTGEVVYEGMMESYQPYLDQALGAFTSGTDIAGAAGTSRYDPRGQIVYDIDPTTGEQVARIDPATGEPVREGGYKDFYDPYVEDVITTSQADIAEALERERSRIGAEAGAMGAFGRRRELLEGTAIGESAAEEGKLAAQLRSAAYTGAQQQAQSAFENQQKRGIQAGQLFQGLGTGIGALGEAAQNLGFQDINTLFNVGQLEQGQLQKEYDVQRASQLEEAYEPFSRFSYMRDILSGVPSSGTSLAASATPQASPLANVMTNANLYSTAQGGGNIFGGLGSLRNVSGA
jgi:hypothetical protein